MEKGKAKTVEKEKKKTVLLLPTQTVEKDKKKTKDCAVVAHIDCREREEEEEKKDCAVVAHKDFREREEEEEEKRLCCCCTHRL